MTERRATEPFETRFAGRARSYTDPATERRMDALATARTAMSARRASAWSLRWPGAGLLGRRLVSARWAAALVAVVLIAVLGAGVLGRLSESRVGPQSTPGPSGGGQIPEALRHTWARPLPVDGRDLWGSGFLAMSTGRVDFGPEQGAAAPASITATGPDTVVVTATVDTTGCAVGDVGTYRWSLKGKGSVLTLTAIGTDSCAAREAALVGDWVRSDFPPRIEAGEVTLAPGRHLTSSFDPFGKPVVSGQLSYTVPKGWKIEEDTSKAFVINHLPTGTAPEHSPALFVAAFMEVRMAADFAEGATCGLPTTAFKVGRGVDDIVAAILARPGVVSTPPAAITIGGYNGQMLDLRIAPSWTGGCQDLGGDRIITIPILHGSGAEPGPPPVVAIGPDHPVRLILLDLGQERTLAIVIFNIEPSEPSAFEELVTGVMPIIESFQFHAPKP